MTTARRRRPKRPRTADGRAMGGQADAAELEPARHAPGRRSRPHHRPRWGQRPAPGQPDRHAPAGRDGAVGVAGGQPPGPAPRPAR